MGKGLPRSLAAAKGNHAVKVKHFKINTTVAVTATSTAVGFGTAVVGDFPSGNILVLGAVANVRFNTADADIGATWDGDFSIGSVATADVDVADSGEADLIASTALGAATAKLSPLKRATNATSVILDNTDDSLEINLNLLIDAANIADDSAANFTATGDLWVAYAVLGDD